MRVLFDNVNENGDSNKKGILSLYNMLHAHISIYYNQKNENGHYLMEIVFFSFFIIILGLVITSI